MEAFARLSISRRPRLPGSRTGYQVGRSILPEARRGAFRRGFGFRNGGVRESGHGGTSPARPGAAPTASLVVQWRGSTSSQILRLRADGFRDHHRRHRRGRSSPSLRQGTRRLMTSRGQLFKPARPASRHPPRRSCSSSRRVRRIFGHFINAEGRIAEFSAVIRPRGGRPHWRIIADLAKKWASGFTCGSCVPVQGNGPAPGLLERALKSGRRSLVVR